MCGHSKGTCRLTNWILSPHRNAYRNQTNCILFGKGWPTILWSSYTEGKGGVSSLQCTGNVIKLIRTKPHPLHTKLGGVVGPALLNVVDDFGHATPQRLKTGSRWKMKRVIRPLPKDWYWLSLPIGRYLCIGEGYGSKTSCNAKAKDRAMWWPIKDRIHPCEHTEDVGTLITTNPHPLHPKLGRVGGVAFLEAHTLSEDAISHSVCLTAIHRRNIMIITIEK